MTEQQENILIARLIEFREGSYNPTAMIRIIKSILSPLPHQDGASAEEIMQHHRILDITLPLKMDIIAAMHQFAKSETAKVVAEKDGEIKQIRSEALDVHADLVEANARITHLEQGMANWVRVSNERQAELNEAEKAISRLSERKIVLPSEINGFDYCSLSECVNSFESGYDLAISEIKRLNGIN